MVPYIGTDTDSIAILTMGFAKFLLFSYSKFKDIKHL